MKIGIDIDDVLFPFVTVFLNYLKQNKGITSNINNIVDWDIHKFLKISKSTFSTYINEFYNSSEFSNIKPYQNTDKVINSLYNKNKLIAVTSRPNHLYNDTEKLLSTYFPNKFSNLIHTKNKGKVAKRLNLYCHIDDRYYNILSTLPYVKVGYLIKQPWNKFKRHNPKIIKLNTLEDIIK